MSHPIPLFFPTVNTPITKQCTPLLCELHQNWVLECLAGWLWSEKASFALAFVCCRKIVGRGCCKYFHSSGKISFKCFKNVPCAVIRSGHTVDLKPGHPAFTYIFLKDNISFLLLQNMQFWWRWADVGGHFKRKVTPPPPSRGWTKGYLF